jgi:chromate reductase, NAD(P)H dehydrogenase (quinone)
MTDTAPVRAVGLVGSLRTGSYNAMLMHAAVDLAPDPLEIVVFDRLGEIPFYDADIEDEPAVVGELRAAIGGADALVVATPEYNFGIPAVLKNALDWASLPPRGSAMHGKTAAIMGASPGMLGTARGQQQLRQMFVFTQTYAVLQPEILVSHAADKFDHDGRLTDELTAKLLRRQLDALVDLTRRLRA